jgi:ATP-dependent helicase HrpB
MDKPQSAIRNLQSAIDRAPLPIDGFIGEILQCLDQRRAAVVVAAPGAGKTTRVPPAVAADGPVIVLQPRRIAARSLARRIAAEQRWTIGDEVGWHVRFERQFGPRTRVLFATEGILTARLQSDPLLTEFRTVVLDEFHERSMHADLGIALARQAWLARDDLRLLIMSATLDAGRVAAYLGGCPVVEVPGALHPLEVRYAPGTPIADAVVTCLRETSRQVLCFLAGVREIAQARREIESSAACRAQPIEIVELHGSLDSAAQDDAIADVSVRRVILATNIAETSLTVPGVTAVVDSGLHKSARYDPDRAVDSLETERISRDAADQRAGRAARTAPGLAIRLWHQADRLRPHREPEVLRIDLAGPALDILAWGGDLKTFEWFEAPSAAALEAAMDLLRRLGAVEDVRLTESGRRMQRLPVVPRLAAILMAAGGARSAALACAILSERHYQPFHPATTTSDLLSAVERERDLPPHMLRIAEQLQSAMAGASRRSLTELEFRRALFAGYPDRVARRRAPGSPRVLMASGHGATMGAESGVRDGEFLIALDVTAGKRGEGSEARVKVASIVEPGWLTATRTRVEHSFDKESGTVRSVARDYYDAIVLAERPVPPDPGEVRRLLADAFLASPLSAGDEQFVRRLRFAGVDVRLQDVVVRALADARSLRGLELASGLSFEERRRLDQDAPEAIRVPSGRQARLEYQEDGTVSASVKLQELFGLADTPRIGPRREPVLFALLAPNGRPVQMTRDLRSFWERTYPEVRKELRGRYPKHPWPDDPWTAPPTHRTARRGVK